MDKARQKRFEKTYRFVKKHFPLNGDILDLGEKNELAEYLSQHGGYRIQNTNVQDLDTDYSLVKEYNYITAFEIFEHLFAPFNLLNTASGKLIASVPLRLWFASEYWNYNDARDCHYHEFSVRQFNHLLKRTGWQIRDCELWKSYDKIAGIRPILRRFYPRYYIVYAEKP
ncbi:MAG TPA: hypothetical protein PLR52_06470 [Bacteroidales bacterium]|nr:hypothetical protein [Bacteroidales bacterium]